MIKQQQQTNLEKYINLESDLTIKGNVLPAVNTLEEYFKNEQINIFDLFKIISEKQFKIKTHELIKLNELAVIKTKSKISFNNREGWVSNPLFGEYSKYKDRVLKGDKFPPILLVHPNVLKSYLKINNIDYCTYNVDGMHRIMSYLEAGINEIETYVIVRRIDINNYITNEDKEEINNLSLKCTWFPKYQQIREVGLQGQRLQEPRYTEIYDFSNLKNKIVVDFGGNLGQSAIEAYFNGAKKIYNFDYQKCAVDTGKKISEILGLNIEYNTIDFNVSSFESDVYDVITNWDWCIYQAIYRTKEINDVKKSFKFIVDNTKEGLYFEGNGDAKIDTHEFYHNVFNPFNFKQVSYLGHTQLRPAYKIFK
jgi:hypothetical protein